MTTLEQTWAWIQPVLPELAEPSQPWDERRRRALDTLGLAEPEQHPLTHELFQHLDAMDEQQRETLDQGSLETLAYQMAAQVAGEQEQEGTEGEEGGAAYDEAAWQAFLTENGPRWDGTEDSWQQFRQWFSYLATEQGLQTPASALLGYLEPMPPANRIAAFAQYGVTIAAAAAGGEQEGREDEAGEDEAGEDGAMEDELAELLSGIEGIEDMSEEEIEQIVSATLEGGNQ